MCVNAISLFLPAPLSSVLSERVSQIFTSYLPNCRTLENVDEGVSEALFDTTS